MFKEIAQGLYAYFPKTFSCNCYLIAAKKPVLIDTGLENQSQSLIDSLQKLGYSIKDISMVLHTHGHADNSRGIGVEDIATATMEKRPHRANGEMAQHVLEIMHAIHDASREGKHVGLAGTCERPAPMPVRG